LICVVLLGAMGILLMTNITRIAKLGLPAVFVVMIVFMVAADSIEKKGVAVKKRAKDAERDAERGAKAEEKVAVRLADLPDGYHGFHDIDFKGFNVDHVVVGPAGIFLIETKSHRGRIDADGDTLLLNGHPPEKNFLNQTWSQKKDLEEFLWKQTSMHWKVHPVLCFTSAFVRTRKPVKGITVASMEYLNKFLLSQPEVMKEEEIAHLTRILVSWIERHEREKLR
jgi:hypothetical protein